MKSLIQFSAIVLLAASCFLVTGCGDAEKKSEGTTTAGSSESGSADADDSSAKKEESDGSDTK